MVLPEQNSASGSAGQTGAAVSNKTPTAAKPAQAGDARRRLNKTIVNLGPPRSGKDLDVRSTKIGGRVGNKHADRLVQRAIQISAAAKMEGEPVCFVGNYS